MDPHPAAPATPAPVQPVSAPAPDRSSESESASPLPLQTGSLPPQSLPRDRPPADIRRPRSGSPAAQIRAQSPSASRPSLQFSLSTPPPASQFRWSALRCNTIPPADRWSAPHPIRTQSPAACAEQFFPAAAPSASIPPSAYESAASTTADSSP